MKKSLILVGGGGHAKSCIDVVESEKKFKILGILDNSKKIGTYVGKYKILGKDKDILKYKRFSNNILISVGQVNNNQIREKIFKRYKKIGFKFPIIISPFARVSKNSKIEEGSIIHHNVVINSGVLVGKNCIINTNAIIEHDSVIKNHTHISTSVTVNGNVEVGKNTFIGSGSILKNSTKIKSFSFIKMGSIIKKWKKIKKL